MCAQNATSGSSIYKVLAVDRDTGSGGSVSYFLQVTPDKYLHVKKGKKRRFSVNWKNGTIP